MKKKRNEILEITVAAVLLAFLGIVLLILWSGSLLASAEEKAPISTIGNPILLEMEATAYCDEGITASGEYTRKGICAAKKSWIGLTALVYEDMDGKPGQLIGIYEIKDTGGDSRIKEGKVIDIWMPSYEECMQFGRPKVIVQLLDAKG